MLRVSDEGPGLDAEQAARVFDRFYRGSEARTGEGTGLGLSIVAALATAHGGRATLDTSPGRGATFTVEIPAIAHPASPGPPTPDAPSAPTPSGAPASTTDPAASPPGADAEATEPPRAPAVRR